VKLQGDYVGVGVERVTAAHGTEVTMGQA